MSYEIVLHTISSFFQERNNTGICSYYFDIIKVGDGYIARVNDLINIGSVVDSNIANFKGVELSVIKLKKYLKNNNISIKNSKLIIYTNSKLLYEVYNKFIPPLSVQRYINSYRRIKNEIEKFNIVEIYYKTKSENRASFLLNSFKKFIATYKDTNITLLLKIFNNNEDIIREREDILNNMSNVIVDEDFSEEIKLGRLIEKKVLKSIGNNKLNKDDYNDDNSKKSEEQYGEKEYGKDGLTINNQSVATELGIKLNLKVNIKKIDKKVIIEMDEEVYNLLKNIFKNF